MSDHPELEELVAPPPTPVPVPAASVPQLHVGSPAPFAHWHSVALTMPASSPPP
jgi:hypothetical protein